MYLKKRQRFDKNMNCYDCGKPIKDDEFRCDKCVELNEEGKIKYPDTGKWGRIRHFGAKKKSLEEVMRKDEEKRKKR